MSPESNKTPELTPEQWEAGQEIADLCELGEDVVGKTMRWNGQEATVLYGLAHSAGYMDYLTPEEIRKAVFAGIEDYQSSVGNPDEAN